MYHSYIEIIYMAPSDCLNTSPLYTYHRKVMQMDIMEKAVYIAVVLTLALVACGFWVS